MSKVSFKRYNSSTLELPGFLFQGWAGEGVARLAKALALPRAGTPTFRAGAGAVVRLDGTDFLVRPDGSVARGGFPALVAKPRPAAPAAPAPTLAAAEPAVDGYGEELPPLLPGDLDRPAKALVGGTRRKKAK